MKMEETTCISQVSADRCSRLWLSPRMGYPDLAEQKIIDFMGTFEGVEIMAEHGFLAGENVVVSAACLFYTA